MVDSSSRGFGGSSHVFGSDAALLDRVRSDDSAAADELRARHAPAARVLAALLTTRSGAASGPRLRDDAVSAVTAESWRRMFSVLHDGGGPRDAFRPHLLAIVTRVAAQQAATQGAVTAGAGRGGGAAVIPVPGPGEPFVDLAALGSDAPVLVLAYLALPETWAAVLWHTEVELAAPSAVAPLFGLAAADVADLTSRARSALRASYLRLYQGEVTSPACREIAGDLATAALGELSRHSPAAAEHHLRSCNRCQAANADVSDLGAALRATLAPLVLGAAAEAYCASVASPAAHAPADRDRPPRKKRGAMRILAVSAGVATVALAVVAVAPWAADHIAVRATDPPAFPAPGATRTGDQPSGTPSAHRHRPAPAVRPSPASARSRAPSTTPSSTPTPAPTTRRPSPRPSLTPPPPVTLLSQDDPVTASSEESYVWAPQYADDGNLNSRWSSQWSSPQWLQVDLGATHQITKVALYWESAAYATAFQIQTSENASTWTTIYSSTSGPGGNQILTVHGTGRFVRMYGTTAENGYGYSLWEFQVFGR
jgi:DNA-directed RNA polymerase specialized sigma24 family protein